MFDHMRLWHLCFVNINNPYLLSVRELIVVKADYGWTFHHLLTINAVVTIALVLKILASILYLYLPTTILFNNIQAVSP